MLTDFNDQLPQRLLPGLRLMLFELAGLKMAIVLGILINCSERKVLHSTLLCSTLSFIGVSLTQC